METRPYNSETADLSASSHKNVEMEQNNIRKKIQPRVASNLLLWLVAAFFIAFLIWAALTELDRTVRGNGKVSPSSRMQVVSNFEGGVVEAILVTIGDLVAKGDPLIRLDQTLAGAELGTNRSQLESLSYKIARLQGEVTGNAPSFPKPTSQAAREQLSIEQSQYVSRMADFQSLIRAAEARLDQAEKTVSEAKANYGAQKSNLSGITLEIETLRPLVDRGLEPRFSLVQAENRLAVSKNQVAAAAASISRAEAAVVEARARITRERQDWRSRAANDLSSAQAEYATLREASPALADRVQRTVVRAPLAGRVNRILTSTVGGTIRPGEPIVEIVPAEDTLMIETAIKPSDIGQVRIGQKADVAITAYRSTVYGTLDGEVVTISPDTTSTDEQSGENYYTVKVVTRGSLLDNEGRALVIGPGMTANVSLLGDKQTVLDYILTPITRLSETALRD